MSQNSHGITQPKIKHKSFTYRTQITRVGERACMLQSEGKPEFRVASPPEFKGEEGVWTPEDLFVAAVDSCVLTTFSAFSLKQNLPVESYESYAEGLLEMADGRYQFTRVYLRPQIVVRNNDAVEQAEKMIHDAHEKCLISNSIKAAVILEPTVRVSQENS